MIKFGGTSVGDGERFVNAARIVTGAAQSRPVAVVVSAMSGTTDALIGYAEATADGSGITAREGSTAELHRSLTERHLGAARRAVDAEYLPEVEERLLVLLERLTEELAAPYENPVARMDRVSVYGERMSAEILAGAISSLGTPAEVVAEDPISTDSNFGGAAVEVDATRDRCQRYIEPLLERDTVAVVPGYVGREPSGAPTTLGRGGSDLSATVLGNAIGSEEVWILSDVDGVLTADPRLVPEARLMSRLSYREASTFAALGAKVLHPRTMEPALASGMEVRVKNTFRPEGSGTSVSNREDGFGVRCIALRWGFKVEVPCSGGYKRAAAAVVCIGAPTKIDMKRGTRSLREAGIPILHSGFSSPGLVFLVVKDDAERALRVLHEDLVVANEELSRVAEEIA